MADEPEDLISDDPEEDESEQAPSAVDGKQQRRIRNKVRREAAEEKQFWEGVFASPVGRRAMWQILNSAHAFDERFANGPNGFPQPDVTWLHAGEQRMGFRLYRSWLRLVPEGVLLMQREHDPQIMPPPKPPRRKRQVPGYWPEEDQ